MLFERDKLLIVGLGKSGLAARDLAVESRANITLYDENPDADCARYGNPYYLGDFPEDVFAEMDYAIFSPGVPLTIPLAKFLREKNVPIIGEIEMAYMLERGRVIGITGTNGKTTTTTLTGEIMAAWNKETYVVGNIGRPYTREVLRTTKKSVTVAEISSFSWRR